MLIKFIDLPNPIITIDGPSGVGKTTLCKILSQKLKFNCLNSGFIYRLLAYLITMNNNYGNPEQFLLRLISNNFFSYLYIWVIQFSPKNLINIINSDFIANKASEISVFPLLRKKLLYFQRSFVMKPGIIADGRDMGTVVFPNAPIKIFLTASLKTRAKRRLIQLHNNGLNVSFESVLSKMISRDFRDKYRLISPLLPANNALLLDTTKLSIDEITIKVLSYIKQKKIYYFL